MPARRLPWFKLESGTTSHPKVAMLSDTQFRVWIELLDAASRQPKRGRFASFDEAAAVTRRPVKTVRSLVGAGLVDVKNDGVWMHDWSDWQDRYPSDIPANAPVSIHDDSANTPPTLREGSAENSTNAPNTLGQEEELRERETPPPIVPPAAADGDTRRPVPKPKKQRVPITDQDTEELVGKYAERFGSALAVRECIEDALNHQARFKAISEKRYVDKWLRTELERRPVVLRPPNGRTEVPVPPMPTIRTGQRNV